MTTDTLWHRGPRLAFATVIMPEGRFQEWTVRRDEENDGLILEWHGVPHARLLSIVAEEMPPGGWRVQGTTPAGERAVWWVQRENCACHHGGPTPLRPYDAEFLAGLTPKESREI